MTKRTSSHRILASLLRAFSSRPDWTVRELSHAVDIDRSGAHRILQDLERAGILRLDGFRPTPPSDRPAVIYNLTLEFPWTAQLSISSSKKPTPNQPSCS